MSLEILGYIAIAISFVGIILNAKKIIWCWLVWNIGNVVWIIYSLIEQDYPSVILWSIFTLSNMYGWYQWKKDRNKNKSDKYNFIAKHPND